MVVIPSRIRYSMDVVWESHLGEQINKCVATTGELWVLGLFVGKNGAVIITLGRLGNSLELNNIILVNLVSSL